MKNRTFLRLNLLCVLGLTACGGTGTVTPELMRLTATAARSSGVAGRAGVTVNSSITIETLKVPIRSITLGTDTGGGGEEVYNCEADTNDGCLVNLAAESALENLLTGASGVSISSGTYTHVSIATCKSEGKYTGKIKAYGKTDPGGSGSTVYTQSTSGALTTSVGSYGEASVYFTGCSRSYPLPVPVTVADDTALSVKLYFDIRDIAFFGDYTAAGAGAYYAGGYSFEYPTVPTGTYVGVNYLDVAGTVDTGNPTVARYRVTTSGGQLGTIGLIYTSGGDYIGGYTRSYFSSATTVGSNIFVTPIQTFTLNADGKYTLKNYGSSATGDGYFNTTAFVLADTGTPIGYTGPDGASAGTYTIDAL